MQAFWDFCLEMGVTEMPPDGETLRLFAAWLMIKRCSKADSMRQYLSAVRTHFNKLGLHVPAPTEFGPLAAVVSGAQRLFPGPVRRSKPVSPSILRNLIFSRPPARATTCQKMTLQILKDTSLLLFFSLLRSSNVFPPHPAAADKIRNLTWEKVKFIEGGAVLSIVLSKTEQYRRQVHRVVLVERVQSVFCPVSALRRLWEVRRPVTPSPVDHVCMLPSESGEWRIMVKYEYLQWFHARITQMGLKKEAYLLHAFRHGGVSLALSEEPNLQQVRLQSHHLSDAVFVYSQMQVERRFTVVTSMLDALDHNLALNAAHGRLARL